MSQLRLWFSGDNRPELLRTSFIGPCSGEEQHSVRGKTAGAYSAQGTFQWTPAVQALCILLLRSRGAAHRVEGTRRHVLLEGKQGSAAASLDYALRKQPVWLAEMFSWDASGNGLSKKLFRRSNSERRRGGPVALRLNEHMLSPESIDIFIDDAECIQEDAINQLAEKIEKQWHPLKKCSRRISRMKKEDLPLKHDWKTYLRDIHTNDVLRSLRETDIFRPEALHSTIRHICECPSFTKIAGRRSQVVSEIDLSLPAAARYGVEHDENEMERLLSPDEPIRCAVPCTLPASSAIFLYLKQIKGYNIELSTRFTHAVEITHRIRNHDFYEAPDICLMGIAPAATLLAQTQGESYFPLMLMPQINQRILASRGAQRENSLARIDEGEYLFLRDDPSTASFYFEDLLRQGMVNKDKVAVHSVEPDDAFKALAEADRDLRAVLFFPYHEINKRFNDCQFIDEVDSSLRNKESVLFVREEFAQNERRLRCLDIAIRDAWLVLRRGGPVLEQIIDEICSDKPYQTFLERCSGLDAASI